MRSLSGVVRLAAMGLITFTAAVSASAQTTACVDPVKYAREESPATVVGPVSRTQRCPDGSRRLNLNGSVYCVSCSRGQVYQIDRKFTCLERCPEGTFERQVPIPIPFIGLVPMPIDPRNCYQCPQATLWVETLAKCCYVQPLECGNIGRLGEKSVIHVSDGLAIEIIEINGGVRAWDAESNGWTQVEQGEIFGPSSRIQTDARAEVKWRRKPAMFASTDPTRFALPLVDLEGGIVTLQQDGRCSGAERCGFRLPGNIEVIAAPTGAGDVIGFDLRYDQKARSVDVVNRLTSSGMVYVMRPGEAPLAIVPPGSSFRFRVPRRP